MSKYRRVYLPNHSYFFTVVTANRNPLFIEDESVQLLKEALRYVQSRRPFKIEAICVLPDHLHCIWTMQEDSNYSVRWQMIKTNFSRQYRCIHPEFKQKNYGSLDFGSMSFVVRMIFGVILIISITITLLNMAPLNMV